MKCKACNSDELFHPEEHMTGYCRTCMITGEADIHATSLERVEECDESETCKRRHCCLERSLDSARNAYRHAIEFYEEKQKDKPVDIRVRAEDQKDALVIETRQRNEPTCK